MRLLVSVRSAEEAVEALAGGAEIIDAKEPAKGPMGQVTPAVAGRILDVLPEAMTFSAALGDPSTAALVADAVRAVPRACRSGEMLVKLGLAGTTSVSGARVRLLAGAEAAEGHPAALRLIAVAYADQEAAISPSLLTVVQLAAEVGAAGVLLDTWDKNGPGLFGVLAFESVAEWVAAAAQAGLMTAIAGRLTAADFDLAARTGAQIVGVRGAACEGGRAGRIAADRIRDLRLALAVRASPALSPTTI